MSADIESNPVKVFEDSGTTQSSWDLLLTQDLERKAWQHIPADQVDQHTEISESYLDHLRSRFPHLATQNLDDTAAFLLESSIGDTMVSSNRLKIDVTELDGVESTKYFIDRSYKVKDRKSSISKWIDNICVNVNGIRSLMTKLNEIRTSTIDKHPWIPGPLRDAASIMSSKIFGKNFLERAELGQPNCFDYILSVEYISRQNSFRGNPGLVVPLIYSTARLKDKNPLLTTHMGGIYITKDSNNQTSTFVLLNGGAMINIDKLENNIEGDKSIGSVKANRDKIVKDRIDEKLKGLAVKKGGADKITDKERASIEKDQRDAVTNAVLIFREAQRLGIIASKIRRIQTDTD